MTVKLRLAHKGLFLVAVPLLVELIFIGSMAFFLERSEAESRALDHSRSVIAAATEVRRIAFQMALNLVMYALSKSQNAKRLIERNDEQYKTSLSELHGLIQADKKQMEWYEKLDKSSAIVFQSVQAATRAVEENADDGDALTAKLGAFQLRSVSEKQSININKALDEIAKIEKAKLPSGRTQMREWVRPLLAAGVFVNVLIAFFAVLFINRNVVTRIGVLLNNSLRLSQNLPLLPRVAGTDEITDLDTVFHQMASTIGAASRLERAVLDNAVDVICVLDQDNKVTRINPACEKVWGYTPDELIGKRIISIVGEKDADATLDYFARLKRGEPTTALENHIRTKNGAENISLWMAQWSDPEGLLFCVAHDVTTRHEIEQLKQEFVAMISHDLRTPLSAVQATLGLVQTGVYGDLDEKGKKRVLTAERNCDRLINLISDLIDFEKMQSGRFELDLSECQSANLVERSVESVHGFAEKEGITLITAACEGSVEADSKRFIQVLVNLLSNAIKFSNKGGKVTIGADRVGDNKVEFYVSDEGRGIPNSHIETIFERFTQVKVTDATEKRGSGLGLSICKSIVETHGGTIGVTSEEGKGSRFFIRLTGVKV